MLSDVVNAVINNKVLGGIAKLGARRAMISTAEDNGIAWSKEVERMAQPQVRAELESAMRAVDGNIAYPDYYRESFHGYDSPGNLNWLAASEAESAAYVMSMRIWPKEGLTPPAAQQRVRAEVTDAVRDFAERHRQQLGGVYNTLTNQGTNGRILDVGCSVGLSTRYLRNAFPRADLAGVDLSPHFLAVAQMREKEAKTAKLEGPVGADEGSWLAADAPPIQWVHAKAEDLPDAADSVDLMVVWFLCHEMPQHAIQATLKEAYRVLKPGGVLVVHDTDPRSQTLRNLPPLLFTLMKSTEPWSDQYYEFDMEGAMRSLGFHGVEYQAANHRHRNVLAYKPTG